MVPAPTYARTPTHARSTALVLTAALTLAGCATLHDWQGHRRASGYIRKNPDRPADILRALDAGRVCIGMRPPEVILCLGRPHRIAAPGDGADPDAVTWHYDETSSARGGERGSALWDLRVPTWRIDFGDAGAVTNIVEYASLATPSPRDASPSAASADRPAAGAAAVAFSPGDTRPDAAPPRPRPPANRVIPVRADFAGWPDLRLNGVTATAGQASAVINGELVEPGDTVAGVRIVRIGANGVLLDFSGAAGFLAPGECTRPPPR